jgi:hypothetical protein
MEIRQWIYYTLIWTLSSSPRNWTLAWRNYVIERNCYRPGRAGADFIGKATDQMVAVVNVGTVDISEQRLYKWLLCDIVSPSGVRIGPTLQDGRQSNQTSIPGIWRKFVSSSQNPDRLLSRISLLCEGYWSSFMAIKRSERKADHSSLPSAEVKNGGAIPPLRPRHSSGD